MRTRAEAARWRSTRHRRGRRRGRARHRPWLRSSRRRSPDPLSTAPTFTSCPARTTLRAESECGRRRVVHPESEREPAGPGSRRTVEDDGIGPGRRREGAGRENWFAGTRPCTGCDSREALRSRSGGSRRSRRRPAARPCCRFARLVMTTPKFGDASSHADVNTRSGPRRRRCDADAARVVRVAVPGYERRPGPRSLRGAGYRDVSAQMPASCASRGRAVVDAPPERNSPHVRAAPELDVCVEVARERAPSRGRPRTRELAGHGRRSPAASSSNARGRVAHGRG